MKENDALNENDKNNFNQKIQDIIKYAERFFNAIRLRLVILMYSG